MSVLAIDIGGTKLAAARVDSNLNIHERREMPTPASKTPDALRAALQTLLEPPKPRARQVAIASTGILRAGSLLATNTQHPGGLPHFRPSPAVDQSKAGGASERTISRSRVAKPGGSGCWMAASPSGCRLAAKR